MKDLPLPVAETKGSLKALFANKPVKKLTVSRVKFVP